MNNNQFYDKYKRNKESKQFYESNAWKKCRRLALIRDNYLCQDCLERKQITKADMVHHVIELKDDKTKALDLNNLRSLCNSCHEKHHNRRGQPKRKVSHKIDVIVAESNPEIL